MIPVLQRWLASAGAAAATAVAVVATVVAGVDEVVVAAAAVDLRHRTRRLSDLTVVGKESRRG